MVWCAALRELSGLLRAAADFLKFSLRLTFYDFFKAISGDKVEKLRIYAIVIHRSGLSC